MLLRTQTSLDYVMASPMTSKSSVTSTGMQKTTINSIVHSNSLVQCYMYSGCLIHCHRAVHLIRETDMQSKHVCILSNIH